MIKVFVVSYFLPTGKKVYWNESLSFKSANKVAKRLALGGYRPSVVRLHFLPSKLIASAAACEQFEEALVPSK